MGAGKMNQDAIEQMSRTQFEHNLTQREVKKKKPNMAGGFKINVTKKKKKVQELKALKNLDVDIHDRWAADPVVHEVIKKHEEEIKRAGHDLSDKPIPDIIPKQQIKRLKVKQSKAIEAPKFEESFNEKKTLPDIRSNKATDYEKDSDAIPVSKIEAVLNKYANDVEQDERLYKTKLEEQKQKAVKTNEDLQVITDDIVSKRTVIQDRFERVKPDKTVEPTRPNTDEWLYEYTKEEYYINRDKELAKKKEEENLKESGNLGGGFSKDLGKSNRDKRKKWNKNSNAVIMSTNVDPKLNSRTAAQLDRLANIQLEASKQDMVINQMYAQIKGEENKNEELKAHLKPKKDKVNREKPVPNVPRKGLFSVENWLSKIDDSLPDELKEKIKPKKLNIKKVTSIVDRLTKAPQKGQLRRDPEQEEVKQILNKYDTSEKRIGGGGKKKFQYRNKLPSSMKKESPVIPK